MNEETHNLNVPGRTAYTFAQGRTLVTPNPETVAPVAAARPKKQDAGPSVEGFEWPTDYAGLLKLSEKHLMGFSPTISGRDYSPFQKELRRRLAEAEQAGTCKVVEVDGNAERVARGRHISTAEKNRVARIGEIERLMALNDWLPIVPERDIPDPYFNFLTTFEAVSILRAWRPVQVAYELELLKNWTYHSPTMRLEEHRSMLSTRPPQDVREAIIEEGKLIASPHFKAIAHLKVSDLIEQYDTTVKPKVLDFLKTALLHIESLKLNAATAEFNFFASQGIADKCEQTAVSKRFDPFIADLQAHIARIENPHAGVFARATAPSPENEIHRLFAIPTLPPQAWR
ncbi:MAG TPA: hypothetical protein VHC44_17140, partial [Verrucomicrobiae bacterium]|nr:hypothetical protein [Verrucomicrobiae bacterium]